MESELENKNTTIEVAHVPIFPRYNIIIYITVYTEHERRKNIIRIVCVCVLFCSNFIA